MAQRIHLITENALSLRFCAQVRKRQVLLGFGAINSLRTSEQVPELYQQSYALVSVPRTLCSKLVFIELISSLRAFSVVQSYLTLYDRMDCSPLGSSVHGISQASILEWVVISYCRGSSRPRDGTCISCVSCIGRWILYHCASWEAPVSCFCSVQFSLLFTDN